MMMIVHEVDGDGGSMMVVFILPPHGHEADFVSVTRHTDATSS